MSYKVPVCRRPEYTIYLQDIGGETWAHSDVKQWSPSISRRLVADANAVFHMHGGAMFALNEPHGCKKHQKFLKLMGFKYLKTLPLIDGGECFIFQRT